MDKNSDNENKDFLEILKHEKLNSKVKKEILFITTDNWLAQLGSRKINELSLWEGNNI